MSVEEAKAIQEIAKTTSKVVGATEKLGGFLSKYTHETLEAGIGIIADKLKYMRWERQCRFIRRADEFLEKEGLSSKINPVPLKHVIPLLEAASLEENDTLQDLYAKLLVNISTTNEEGVPVRSFIDVLERFTPKMMEIFNNVYKAQLRLSDAEKTDGIDIENTLPEDIGGPMIIGGYSPEIGLAWNELDRQNCLRVTRTKNNGKVGILAKHTLFGMALYAACTLPSDNVAERNEDQGRISNIGKRRLRPARSRG